MNKTYAYHKPSESGQKKISALREAFSTLTEVVENTCPKSRELSIVLTNLEQAAMWSIKSVVHNDPESQIETA